MTDQDLDRFIELTVGGHRTRPGQAARYREVIGPMTVEQVRELAVILALKNGPWIDDVNRAAETACTVSQARSLINLKKDLENQLEAGGPEPLPNFVQIQLQLVTRTLRDLASAFPPEARPSDD